MENTDEFIKQATRCRDRGDFQSAFNLLKRAFKINPTKELAIMLGKVCEEKKEPYAAFFWYMQAGDESESHRVEWKLLS